MYITVLYMPLLDYHSCTLIRLKTTFLLQYLHSKQENQRSLQQKQEEGWREHFHQKYNSMTEIYMSGGPVNQSKNYTLVHRNNQLLLNSNFE